MAAKVTKKQADFRHAKPNDNHRCGNCVMFRPATNLCTKVAGFIQAFDVCNYFYPKSGTGIKPPPENM